MSSIWRRRRTLADYFGSRSLYGLHGLERTTIKSAYHLSWRQHIDPFSGRPVFMLRGNMVHYAAGPDKWIEKVHGEQALVNQEFRKIEP